METQPGLDHPDGVGQGQGDHTRAGGRQEVGRGGELLVPVAPLQRGLEGVVEEEVEAPGRARAHNVGGDALVEAGHALSPHDARDCREVGGAAGPTQLPLILIDSKPEIKTNVMLRKNCLVYTIQQKLIKKTENI